MAAPVTARGAVPQSTLSVRLTRRRQWRLFLLTAPLVLFLLVVYGYPLVGFLSRSFFDPNLTSAHISDLTESSASFRIIWITFRLAFTVTLACLLLGYPVAYVLSSVSAPVGNLLMVLVLVPFWTSILVRTYAWMVILGHEGVINNFLIAIHVISSPLPILFNEFSVHVGMIQILLPFMILTLYSVMRGIDRNLLRAARSLGASPFTAFLRIFLPLSLPGIFGGCVLVFILSLGFYITPSLLGGPTDYTISMYLYIIINELLNWGFAALLALILLAATLLVILLATRVVRLDQIYGGGR